MTSNFALLIAVIVFVAQSPNAGSSQQNALSATQTDIVNPLDQLSSADIAVHVAQMANLYEKQSVVNNADTVNAQLTIAPVDDQVITKPQVVSTDVKSRHDIETYVVQNGDTIASIAEKFGITSDSIRWSNGLGSSVSAGDELTIPPINGIVYTVKDGDTAETLAQRYSASKEDIVKFNDAEVSGLVVGQQIVIPDAVQPVTRYANSIYSSGSFAWGGYSAIYGGNGYDYGYCTWWVAIRRAQIGRPIPSNLGNASTWKVLSQRAGLSVGSTPAQGAVIWTPPRDYYGHVGFVEEVFPDGSVRVSEMNVAGWGVRSEKVLSPAQAAGYSYIY